MGLSSGEAILIGEVAKLALASWLAAEELKGSTDEEQDIMLREERGKREALDPKDLVKHEL